MAGGVSRKTIAEQLSKAVSLEEVIIDTVAEMCRQKRESVADAFKQSETGVKLYQFDTGYYLNDIHLIIAEFVGECVLKLGWRVY